MIIFLVAVIAMPIAAQDRGGCARRTGDHRQCACHDDDDPVPDGGQIPVNSARPRKGSHRQRTSPAISANTPAGTQSFLLNMHDMDVVSNKTSDDQAHWVVWNIPATATGLPEGVPKGPQLADGSYQISATGQVYRGPGAPANGPPHHYTFELFALDTKLDVQPTADAFETRANVLKAAQGHILGKAVYGGLF